MSIPTTKVAAKASRTLRFASGVLRTVYDRKAGIEEVDSSGLPNTMLWQVISCFGQSSSVLE